jgi:hypothetical protein
MRRRHPLHEEGRGMNIEELERRVESARFAGDVDIVVTVEQLSRLCAIARAARPVAFSNGFDAALPDKLAALRAAMGKER